MVILIDLFTAWMNACIITIAFINEKISFPLFRRSSTKLRSDSIDWLKDKDWFMTMKLSYPNRGISQVANLAAKWLLSKKPIPQGQTSWLMPNWDQFKVKSDHGHGQNNLRVVESRALEFMSPPSFLIWDLHHYTKTPGNSESKVRQLFNEFGTLLEGRKWIWECVTITNTSMEKTVCYHFKWPLLSSVEKLSKQIGSLRCEIQEFILSFSTSKVWLFWWEKGHSLNC